MLGWQPIRARLPVVFSGTALIGSGGPITRHVFISFSVEPLGLTIEQLFLSVLNITARGHITAARGEISKACRITRFV